MVSDTERGISAPCGACHKCDDATIASTHFSASSAPVTVIRPLPGDFEHWTGSFGEWANTLARLVRILLEIRSRGALCRPANTAADWATTQGLAHISQCRRDDVAKARSTSLLVAACDEPDQILKAAAPLVSRSLHIPLDTQTTTFIPTTIPITTQFIQPCLCFI
jgi:hypothetical protein